MKTASTGTRLPSDWPSFVDSAIFRAGNSCASRRPGLRLGREGADGERAMNRHGTIDMSGDISGAISGGAPTPAAP
jgi:hypothetical protein